MKLIINNVYSFVILLASREKTLVWLNFSDCPCGKYRLWFRHPTDVCVVLRRRTGLESFTHFCESRLVSAGISLCALVFHSSVPERTLGTLQLREGTSWQARRQPLFIRNFQRVSISPNRLQYELLLCYIQHCGAILLVFTCIFIFHFTALSVLHQDLESFARKDSFCNRRENQIVEKDFFFDSISTHLQVKPHSLAFFLHSLSPKFPRMSLYFPLPLHNHLIYFSLYQQSSLFSFPLIFVRSSTCSYFSIQCTHPFCPLYK